ncbi:MAG: YaaC family protein [Hyphomicrobium sp.]|uniref:YaaC family protein n=1 Tax=Hyphomicrobium sp. TaxID=82 RepID=UPI0039E34823
MRGTFFQSPTRRLPHIWTANPEQAIWDLLRVLQQPAAVENILTGNSGARGGENVFSSELAGRRSRDIAYLIVQAEEYYRSAEVASLATRPLPLYYGMLTLSKAAILAWNDEISLLDLKYHGLDSRPRSGDLKLYKETPDKWTLSDEYASANSGVFTRLAGLYGVQNIAVGDVFTFDDILKTDAELAVAYNRMNNFGSLTFPLYSSTVSDDPVKIVMYPSTRSVDEFKKIFAFIEPDFEISPALLHDQAITVTSRNHLLKSPAYLGFEHPDVGGRYIVGPALNLSDGKKRRYVPRPIADYAGMFILSDLVRYRPQFWVEVVRGDPRGNVGLVSLFVASCRRRFAHAMLNALYGERFSFGTAARLG